MSHYEERLEQDLEAIRSGIAELGEAVEKALADAVRALLDGDRALANRTALGDLAINRRTRAIDRQCHAFVARHLPSAGHLRFVSAVLRLTIALERIGDYAVNLCREALQLSAPPSGTVARDIELMADQCGRLLHEALTAFRRGSAEEARATRELSSGVGSTFHKVFEDLLQQGEQQTQPLRDLFALVVVFNRLERVGDQARNICEETLFAVAGETKKPKVYRMLFVEREDSCRSQLAAAYARKAFPESGHYETAGWQPAPAVDPRLADFLSEAGVSLGSARPRPLPRGAEQLGQYHVIVSLDGDLRPHVETLPFHTIVLEWDLGPCPAGDADAQATRAALGDLYRRLAVEVSDLMKALRGDDAQ